MGYKAGDSTELGELGTQSRWEGASLAPKESAAGLHALHPAGSLPPAPAGHTEGTRGLKQADPGPLHTVLLEKKNKTKTCPDAPAGSALGEGELTLDP